MSRPLEPQCRIVAEREADSRRWTFFLVNDDDAAIQSAELVAVRYEWGGQYRGGESPGVRICDLAPGARESVWHDDGGSEMRTDLWVRVTRLERDTWLLFEFPRLYRLAGRVLVAHPQAVDGPPAGLP